MRKALPSDGGLYCIYRKVMGKEDSTEKGTGTSLGCPRYQVPTGFEPVHRGFADLSLTTWVRHHCIWEDTRKQGDLQPCHMIYSYNIYELFCLVGCVKIR